MNTKKWTKFEDWEEIFGKDRATGEFAEGPLDTSEQIQKSQAPKFYNDMNLGFPIDIDEDEEADAYHKPKVFTEEAENAIESSSFTGAENVTGPSAFTEAENAIGPSAGASEKNMLDPNKLINKVRMIKCPLLM
nr:uncharacterized protein LOC108945973 isoform X2 [Nicotiana tomentosiformis]